MSRSNKSDDAPVRRLAFQNGHPRDASPPYGAPRNANLPIGEARGWHDRGYIPHFDGLNATQHVTFHLADSLPADVVKQLTAETKHMAEADRDRARRARVEAWLDAGHGSCILRDRTVAKMMQDTLVFFHDTRYKLLAWVVMPNHVHVLFRPMANWSMASAVASWKKHSAMQIRRYERENATLLSGEPQATVWHREYWDRYMRDEDHLRKTIDYIHQNPVKAGLVNRPDDWPWSSAAGTPLS